MNAIKIVAIVIIALGVFALVYGGFSYTRQSDATKIGPFEIYVKERKTVNIPIWAGIAAIAIGGLLLFLKRKTV
jgi:LPXTG-motif cell wall-anchored protein